MHSASRRHFLAQAGAATASAAALPWPAAAAAPAVHATLLDGRPFNSEEQGGKVLLVNFWATWCAPCRAEMPAIDAYYRAHRARGLEVLAMSTDSPSELAKVQAVASGFSFPVALLKASRLSGLGRIWRLPSSVVFDRQGALVRQDWFVEDGLDAARLDAVLGPLLAA